MLKLIKQYFVDHDNDYIVYKKYYELFNELINFEYELMTFTGSKEDILDFSKSSMFLNNDPIEIICKHTIRTNCKPLSDEEVLLSENISNLIILENVVKQSLRISKFSGLLNAKAQDRETLEKYGLEEYFHGKYGKHNKKYNDCTIEEYCEYLKNDIINSNKVKSAVYHVWSNRYYFINYDCSHRLAVLNHLDIIYNQNILLDLELEERTLDKKCAKIIFENFVGIITVGKTYSLLSNLLKQNKVNVLLENITPMDDRLYILWIEKSNDKILSDIIKFTELLPSNMCYEISKELKKHIS